MCITISSLNSSFEISQRILFFRKKKRGPERSRYLLSVTLQQRGRTSWNPELLLFGVKQRVSR